MSGPTTEELAYLGKQVGKNAPLTKEEYEKLIAKAIHLSKEHCEAPKHDADRVYERICHETVTVPIEEETIVPITREVMKPGYRCETVKGKRLVPKQRWKTVEEKCIEVKEEVEKKTRKVWKPVQEEYYEITKKPIEVIKKKQIPYTEYCEEEVDMVVEVPCDKVCVEHGHRVDKQLKSKQVQIQRKEKYKLVPHFIEEEALEKKDLGDYRDFGVCEHGIEVFPGHHDEPCKAPTCIEECPLLPKTGIKSVEYNEVDAFSQAGSVRPSSASRRMLPPSRGQAQAVTYMPQMDRPATGQLPPSRGSNRPSSRGLDRPPTGALYQDENGQIRRQQAAAAAMHPSVQQILNNPEPRRLQTPSRHSQTVRPPTSSRPQQGSQVLSLGKGGRPSSGLVNSLGGRPVTGGWR